MKVRALLLMLICFPVAAEACKSYQDSWVGEDKAAHFAVSTALGLASSQLSDNAWTAFGLALAPGVAKELYDSQQACKRFSWRDLSWDAAGAYVGVRTGHWFISPAGVSFRAQF